MYLFALRNPVSYKSVRGMSVGVLRYRSDGLQHRRGWVTYFDPTDVNRRTLLKGLALLPLSSSELRGAAPLGKIKITGFDIHKVSVRWRDLMFVEVHTDAGITGLGEATLESRTDVAEAVLRWREPEYVGLDPAGPEGHWDRVYYVATRWRNGPALMTGLSAIDMALWDIEAKRLGVPLYSLLGGPIRDQLRVYFTHWDASIPPQKRELGAYRELAASTLEQGWTAVKYTLGQADTELERVDKDVAVLAAVRNVFGTKADIGLECAETFSVRSAIEMATAMAPYHPLFMEEPTLREIRQGSRRWRQRVLFRSPPVKGFSRASSSSNCWTRRARRSSSRM